MSDLGYTETTREALERAGGDPDNNGKTYSTGKKKKNQARLFLVMDEIIFCKWVSIAKVVDEEKLLKEKKIIR